MLLNQDYSVMLIVFIFAASLPRKLVSERLISWALHKDWKPAGMSAIAAEGNLFFMLVKQIDGCMLATRMKNGSNCISFVRTVQAGFNKINLLDFQEMMNNRTGR